MHTTTLRPVAAARFAWKEYRTLRGLWLAVLLLGLFLQWFLGVVSPPTTDWATLRFAIALGATVLYAVGAAATVFSAEHDDETYALLAGLPIRWLPLFAGKLAFVAASALALAALLTIVGWMTSSFRFPDAQNAKQTAAIFGLAIVEAIAWGTLFSLLVRRPLVAALLTIVVGIVAVQIAVSAGSQQPTPLSNPRAYLEAIPLRIALAACVFASATLLARTWLTPTLPTLPRRARFSGRGVTLTSIPSTSTPTPLLSHLTRFLPHPIAPARRTTLAHLLWQTWQQSWQWLLAPLPIAAFLAFGLLVATGTLAQYAQSPQFIPIFLAYGLLLLPAMYGALVFSGDQRRHQYRFLAEHAARPRYVWFARHLVWGGALVIVGCTVLLAIAMLLGTALARGLRHDLQYAAHEFADPSQLGRDLSYFTGLLTSGGGMVLIGLLLAYAVGQLFSMLLRSEILATFATCVALAFVAAWGLLMFGWQLSGWWFVFPLAASLLLATWLRAPAWITERNTWRHWLAPAAAITLPAAAILASVPSARLDQIPPADLKKAEATLAPVEIAYVTGDYPAARETAAMYMNAVDLWNAPIGEFGKPSPIDKWRTSEFEDGYSDFDVEKLSADERSEFNAAMKQWFALQRENHERATKEFLAATRRPTCRFDFHGGAQNKWLLWSMYQRRLSEYFENSRSRPDVRYARLVNIMMQLVDEADDGAAPERYLALLRASTHVRSAQPTPIFADQLLFECLVLQRIRSWAVRPETTDDQLRTMIEQLQSYFALPLLPDESLIADRDSTQKALLEQDLPLALNSENAGFYTHFAYLLNKLPWERERGLRELDVTTAQQIREINGLVQFLANDGASQWPTDHAALRTFFDSLYYKAFDHDPWRNSLPFATLSRREINARTAFFDLKYTIVQLEVDRRAILLQLALQLYERDHGRYPSSLTDLVPDYLAELPLDPFSGEPFPYLPHGVDLPLIDINYENTYIARPTTLPPGTPFFWSVGPWNVTQPARTTRSWYESLDGDADPVNESETYYALRRTDLPHSGWLRGNAFALFPLPMPIKPTNP